jgi:hypothetical protein
MPDPGTLRDSTEIRLPQAKMREVRDDLETEFTVTIVEDGAGTCRIIASPVVIQSVSRFLARRGITHA